MRNRVGMRLGIRIVIGFLVFFGTVWGSPLKESQAAGRRSLTLEANTAEIQKFGVKIHEIFIANPEIADVQMNNPQVAYIFAKKPGSTTIFATDEEGQIMLSLDIRVVHNLAQLNQTLQSARPQESVKALSTPHGIVISGEVSSAKVAADILAIAQRFVQNNEPIVNDMTILKPSQVYLKVKVAEVKRTALNTLNINWGASMVADRFTFGMLQGAAPIVNGGFRRLAAGSELGGLGARFTDGRSNIDTLIDILSTERLATVLAEPNLVALSGETASFLAGGEFPFPVPQDTNITVEFKEFGISLAFTPTVLSNNQINLRVRPEVSELDSTRAINVPIGSVGTLPVPGIKTRRAETSVELGSGESLAVAGLFSNSMQSTIRELPGLADIPILGALFRSNDFQREETELVIVVTPYIVAPTPSKALELPMDTLRHSSNLERIFWGLLNQPESRVSADSRLFGAAGFYVD